MMIIGYHPASARDATGHRVAGYQVYGIDRIEGVQGFLPISVFLARDALAQYVSSPKSLLFKVAEISQDPYGRLCALRMHKMTSNPTKTKGEK